MNREPYPKRRTRYLSHPALAVAIGCVVALGVVGGTLIVSSHTSCGVGAAIVTESFWTPYSLTNAPYLGSTNYSASFALFERIGPTQVTLSNGTLGAGNLSTGYFETQNWTAYTLTNQSEVGSGVDTPCLTGYTAIPSAAPVEISVDGEPLQGPGNTSNLNEPTSFDEHPPASAVFANGFVSANLPSISTCGRPAESQSFSSRGFDVLLPFETGQTTLSVVVTIISTESFQYHFPADGGTWIVDDLQDGPGMQGPGLAFSWEPC